MSQCWWHSAQQTQISIFFSPCSVTYIVENYCLMVHAAATRIHAHTNTHAIRYACNAPNIICVHAYNSYSFSFFITKKCIHIQQECITIIKRECDRKDIHHCYKRFPFQRNAELLHFEFIKNNVFQKNKELVLPMASSSGTSHKWPYY